MITLIITLASIWFYFLCGWLAAVRNLPRAWREARAFWHDSDMARTSVKTRTAFMLLLWVFYIPGRAICDWFGHVVDAGDPEVLADRIRAQQKRIAELEREAGIR